MTSWRPANTITVKALALIWRDDALLLSEIHDDAGRVKGMRPLGGTVEFGEPWRDTLQREFLEELGTRIGLLDRYIVMENLFEHHGTPGHEIVFLCDAYFEDSNFFISEISSPSRQARRSPGSPDGHRSMNSPPEGWTFIRRACATGS
ncbi:NUDIX domain-containing protein [Roseibium salinum]|nr:NUDIX domain-containing protein [Roseibium salinum]